MTSAATRKLTLLVICLGLTALTSDSVASAPAVPPNPMLVFMGQEFYETGGKSYTRYKYFVDNFQAYPSDLFAPAPKLPPCGANTNSSRTWVDVFNQSGKRLYGFCALGSPADLGKLWFALETDVVPPSWVYIELNDRQTNTKYKSNLAETVE
ncbi:MAG: hypothetical protein ND895_15095 [Pyrinomonadaceae bacterium]|nr:hypothetical protein [Pyrinomonadaceae bacterium]